MTTILRLIHANVDQVRGALLIDDSRIGINRDPTSDRRPVHSGELLVAVSFVSGLFLLAAAAGLADSEWSFAGYVGGAMVAFIVAARWLVELRRSPCMADL